MVRLAGFAAINQDRAAEDKIVAQQSLEAQEARIISNYERALREIQANNLEMAEAAFIDILNDSLVKDGATDQLHRLRFLSYKNLANVVANFPDRRLEALELFNLAASIDGTDIALWDKYGTLAAQSGEWAAAKSAFEEVLILDPHHPTVASKLYHVLSHIGDTARARAFSRAYIQYDPYIKANSVQSCFPVSILKLPTVNHQDQNKEKTTNDDTDDNDATQPMRNPPITVTLDDDTWQNVLNACTRILANPETTAKKIKFRFQKNQPLMALQDHAMAEPGDVTTLKDTGNASGTIVPNASAEPTATGTIIPPLTGVDDAPGQQQSLLDNNDNDALKLDGLKNNSKNENQPPTVAPSRRSVRYRNAQSNFNRQDEEENNDEKQFRLIRTLAPTLCSPNRPKNAPSVARGADKRRRKKKKKKTDCPTHLDGPQNDDTDIMERTPTFTGSCATHQDTARLWFLPTKTTIDTGDSEPEIEMEPEKSRSISASEASIAMVEYWVNRCSAEKGDSSTSIQSPGLSLLHLATALEKHGHWQGETFNAEQCLLLAELYCDGASVLSQSNLTSHDINEQSIQQPTENEITDCSRSGKVWLSRFRASRICVVESEDDRNLEIRYWWARGRLCEAESCAEEASHCYRRCVAALEASYIHTSMQRENQAVRGRKGPAKTPTKISLPHCRLDSIISMDTLDAKLELLQLHEVLSQAEHAANSDDGHRQAIDILAPVLLSCSPKETLMAVVDQKTWQKALKVLLDAAIATDNVLLQLRCSIRLLRSELPQIPSKIEKIFNDPENGDAERSAVNNRARSENEEWSSMIKKFVGSRGAAHLASVASLLSSPSLASLTKQAREEIFTKLDTVVEVHSLLVLLRQCLYVVNSCASFLSSTPACTQSSLSSTVHAARRALSDAAVVSLQLWSIDSGSEVTPESILDWTFEILDVVGSNLALVSRQGSVPAVALYLIQHALELLGAQNDDDSGEVRSGLRCGLHHCLYFLHGIRLPGLDKEAWGGGIQQYPLYNNNTNAINTTNTTNNMNRMMSNDGMVTDDGVVLDHDSFSPSQTSIPSRGLRPLDSQDAALSVWLVIQDQLSELSEKALNKNKEFFETMFTLFPMLPRQFNEKMDSVFDRELVNKSAPAPIDLVSLQPSSSTRNNATTTTTTKNPFIDLFHGMDDKYLPVYKSLFYYKRTVFQSVDELKRRIEETFPESSFLDAQCDPLIAQFLYTYKADLALNPRQHKHPDGWYSLALVYHAIADQILLKAAERIPHRQWQHRGDVHKRISSYRNLGHWCTFIESTLNKVNSDNINENKDMDEVVEGLVEVLELAASALFDHVADVPPQFDAIDHRPSHDDRTFIDNTIMARDIYRKAIEILPEEWLFKLQLGRCLRRLGEPPSEWLPLFAAACKHALDHQGGVIDPVYTLHAARLKLLHKKYVDVETLRLVARYCFNPGVKATMESTLLNEDATGNITIYQCAFYVKMLLSDGTQAMLWCTERDKTYHRAPMLLAKLNMATNPSAVFQHLSPYFSKPKVDFAINMNEYNIPMPSTTSGRKKHQRRLEQKVDGDEKGNGIGNEKGNETEYGLCPHTKSAGIGQNESSLIFIGRLRKAFVMYFNACLQLGKIDVLDAAARHFEAPKNPRDAWLTRPGFKDIRSLVKGYCVLYCLESALQICPLPTLASPLPPPSQAQSPLKKQQQQGLNKAHHMSQQYHYFNILADELASTQPKAQKDLQRVFTLWTECALFKKTGTAARSIASPSTTIIPRNRWESEMRKPARAAFDFLCGDTQVSTISHESNRYSQAMAGMFSDPSHQSTLKSLLEPGSTALESVFKNYSHLYIHLLGSLKDIDKLRALLFPLRREFRQLNNVVDAEARYIVILVCCTGVKALQRIGTDIIEQARLFNASQLTDDTLKEPWILADQGIHHGRSSGGFSTGTKSGATSGTILGVGGGTHQQQNIQSGGAESAAAAMAGAQLPPRTASLPPAPEKPIEPVRPPHTSSMPPTILSSQQEAQLRQYAMTQTQGAVQWRINAMAVRGQMLSPSAIQMLQQTIFSQLYSTLTKDCLRREQQQYHQQNAEYQPKKKQHDEAMKTYESSLKSHERVKKLQAAQDIRARNLAESAGLVSLSVPTEAESTVQEKCAQLLNDISIFLKGAPWMSDADSHRSSPALKAASVSLESLRIQMLRVYCVLGHIDPSVRPADRAQARQWCDAIVRSHNKKAPPASSLNARNNSAHEDREKEKEGLPESRQGANNDANDENNKRQRVS